jgi:hypothetical protein
MASDQNGWRVEGWVAVDRYRQDVGRSDFKLIGNSLDKLEVLDRERSVEPLREAYTGVAITLDDLGGDIATLRLGVASG